MHKLLVLYPPPNDAGHFRNYYANTHVPLVNKIPGLRSFRYGLDARGMGADSPYFGVAELEFDSAAAMGDALDSPEGRATIGDVPNYATGGAVVLHYELAE